MDIQIVSYVSRDTDINTFNLDTNDFDTRVLVGILEIPEVGNALMKISAGVNVNGLVNYLLVLRPKLSAHVELVNICYGRLLVI